MGAPLPLQDNAEPLLHSPYHRIVQYLDIKLMARIGAATLFEGDRIDTNKVTPMHGL